MAGKNGVVLMIVALVLVATSAPVKATDNQAAFGQYLADMGNTYIEEPEIRFFEIGTSAPKKADRIWPFDLEETKQKYRKAVSSIMGTVFLPAAEDSPDALRVSLSVGLLNDKDAISALIEVKVYKDIDYYYTPEGKEPILLSYVRKNYWDKKYLYIEADYFSDPGSAKYALRETIDKYFNEFLFGFVQHAIYGYRLQNQIIDKEKKESKMDAEKYNDYHSRI